MSVAAWRPSHNFSAAAGPLPPEVAEEVAAACRCWRGTGSVLSLPFTSEAFRQLQYETEASLRRLLRITCAHRLLFLQGGASAQFALAPLNLLGSSDCAAYVDTGHWSRRAMAEAARYCRVLLPEHDGSHVHALALARLEPHAAYLHITSNETANGFQFPSLPVTTLPLVVDMTSDFLTRVVAFSRIGMMYASTQKTLGAPGLTLVFIREDMLGRAQPATPSVMNYAAQAEASSRLNTPPVFAIFVAHAMLCWIERQGGLEAMTQAATRRSAAVYQALDQGGGFYRPSVAVRDRSRINPCFQIADEALTACFLAQAQAAGLSDLQGHPNVGGIRVSIYNGTSDAAVAALVAFLREFHRVYG